MPELKFIITGDNSALLKSLSDSEKEISAAKNKVNQDAASGVSIAKEQVNQTKANIAAINEETAAVRKLNLETYNNSAKNAKNDKAPKPATEPTNAPVSNVSLEIEKATSAVEEFQQEGTVALSAVDELIKLLNADLEAGVLSAEEFRTAINAIGTFDAFKKEEADVLAANKAIQEQLGIIEELELTLAALKEQKLSATTVPELEAINKKIQDTELSLKEFGNAGKVGFDQLGNKITSVGTNVEQAAVKSTAFENAISRATNISAIMGRAVTMLTRQLIGLGVGFLSFYIGAKAVEALISWVQNLDMFSGRLNQAKHNLDALNETMAEADKAAGKQKATLDLLYTTATDVNKSMKDRLSAAQQLRESFAAEFANSSKLAIVNGELKSSYEALSQSIIESAKSQAAFSKISSLESDNLDAQFQIDKNNSVKATQIAAALAQYRRNLANQSDESKAATAAGKTSYVGASGGFFNTPLGTFQATMKQIKGQTDIHNTIPAQTQQINNKTIGYLTGFIKNVTKSADDLNSANKLLGNNLENFYNLLGKAGSEQDLKNIQSALQTKLNALTPSDAQFAKIQADLAQVDKKIQAYSVKPDVGVNAASSLLASQKALLDKSAALKGKYFSKDKTADEQAIDDIKATFKAQNDAIDAQNKKLADDLKNKRITPTQAAQIGVTPKLTDADLNNAIASAKGAQAVEKTKLQIEQQKVLFQEYEDFKLRAGTEAADKLYSEQTKGFKNYIDYLKSLEPTEAQLNSDDPLVKKTASGMKDLLDKTLIPDAQNDEIKQAQANFQDLLISNQTYQQQRETLIARANDDIAALNAKGFSEQAAQAKQNLQDDLTQLDEAQVAKLSAYKDLFDGVHTLTVTQSRADIATIQTFINAQLKAGKITQEAWDRINKDLSEASKKVDSDLPDKIKAVGAAFSSWGSSLSGLDENLGKALSTMGDMVSAAGSIKANLNTLSDPNASSTDQLSAGLGLVTTAVSVISSIAGLFSHSQANAEQAKFAADQQLKAQEAITKQLERQLDVANQLYGSAKIDAYSKQLQDIAKAQADAENKLKGKIELTDNNALNKEITKYNAGQSYNQFFLFKDLIDKLTAASDLGSKSIEQLQQLIDNGKLDDGTAAIAQSLIDLKQQAIDTTNALNLALTGVSFDDLVSNFHDMFETLNSTTEDWANNFKKTIQDAFIKAFETQYLDDKLQSFYDQLTTDLKNDKGKNGDSPLTDSDLTDLTNYYNTIASTAQAGQSALQQIFGKLGLDTNTASSALNQSIQSITSDQANALEGIDRGMYDYTKQLFAGQQIANNILSEQYDIAVKGLLSWQAIEFNTAQTVAELKISNTHLIAANAALSSIVSNTKPTSMRGGGLSS
jgi:hypothetical protein